MKFYQKPSKILARVKTKQNKEEITIQHALKTLRNFVDTTSMKDGAFSGLSNLEDIVKGTIIKNHILMTDF